VTNVFTSHNNVTRVDFQWNIPSQDETDVFPLPTYLLSFRARYGSHDPYLLNNVSSCTKTIAVRICGGPTFDQPRTRVVVPGGSFFGLLSSPSWIGFGDAANRSCGLAEDRPCLAPAIVTVIDGISARIVTLQASTPTPQELRDGRTPSAGLRVGQPLELVIAARGADPARPDRLRFEVRPAPPRASRPADARPQTCVHARHADSRTR
jgi:hypothetical protein